MQPKNNNLDYLIDPTFRNINRLLIYFHPKMVMMILQDIVFIGKNRQEAYETLIETSGNDDYTIGILLEFSYHQNYYKFISIDFSRRTSTSILQQTSFLGKLEEDDGVTMFFYC